MLIKHRVWSGKTWLPVWHCCGSVSHFTVSFSKNRFDEMASEWGEDGALSQGEGVREEKGEEGRMLRAESQAYCCVFSHRQQRRKWNRAAKYTKQHNEAASVEQLWNMAVTRFRSVKHRGPPFYLYRRSWPRGDTLPFRYTHTSRRSTRAHTQSHTLERLSANRGPSGSGWTYRQLYEI